MGSVFGIKKPKVDKELYKDPYQDELRTRLLAFIDGGLQKSGFDKLIPPEHRPYSLLSEEERARVREQRDQESTADNPAGDHPYIHKPGDLLAPRGPATPVAADAPKAKDPREEPLAPAQNAGTPDGVRPNVALLAALESRRLGMSGPYDFHPDDPRAQEQALNFLRYQRKYRPVIGGGV